MRRFVLTLGVALLPAAASAIDWSTRLGLDYTRIDARSDDGPSSTMPRLDLNLGLDASGFLSAPGVALWSATGQYQRITTSGDQLGSTRDILSYRAKLSLLNSPRSPLALELFARRHQDDYSVDAPNGDATVTSTTIGGTARLALRDRPTLSLGYTLSDDERRGQLWPSSDNRIHTLTASSSLGAPAFTYTADYRGNFSEGTYVADDFADHRVDLNGRAILTPTADFRVSDTYYLRLPSTVAAVNPHQELNTFSAAVRNSGSGLEYQQYAYRYTRALQTSALTPDAERSNQRADVTVQHVLTPEWRIRATADASLQDDRLGASTDRASGENVGAVASWTRRAGGSATELRGGPSFGLLQPSTGGQVFGYGASAGASLRQAWAPYTIQLNYDVSYASNLHAIRGWNLRQNGNASVDRPFGGGVLTASVLATANAFDSPVFGPAVGRQIQAVGRYQYASWSGFLQYTLSSNLRGAVNDTLASDGLFIPPGYDSHSRMVSAGLSARLFRSVTAKGELRLTSTDLPDRPTFTENELRGSVEWDYGALRIALEDRYLVTDVNDTSGSRNLLMVKIYRVFGSRY